MQGRKFDGKGAVALLQVDAFGGGDVLFDVGAARHSHLIVHGQLCEVQLTFVQVAFAFGIDGRQSFVRAEI